MTPEQCRAARGWLDWSQDELAKASRVSLSTVRDFEKGRRTPIGNNLAAIAAALNGAGIVLHDGGISFEPAKGALPSTGSTDSAESARE